MRFVPLFVFLLACGGSTPEGDTPPTAPSACADRPTSPEARENALRTFGQRVYVSLRAGAPERLLYDDVDLEHLLTPEAATRARALRAGLGARLSIDPARFRVLADAEPEAICLQGTRSAPPADPRFGNNAPAWTFERALISGIRPDGRKLGAWVEGSFLYSDVGFGATDLTRVEVPRWEHSDLEIATCDVRVHL